MSGTLARDIKSVSLICLILGAVQILITVPLGHFGIGAVFGTLLGVGAAIFNFALMGIMLEYCLSKKNARSLVGFGYILRLAIIAAIVIWSMKASYLNYVCVIIPLVFPQISIFVITKLIRRPYL